MDKTMFKKKGPIFVAIIAGVLLVITALTVLFSGESDEISGVIANSEGEVEHETPEEMTKREKKKQVFYLADEYGIEGGKNLDVLSDKIKKGESLSVLLDDYGVNAPRALAIANESKKVFDVRRISIGNSYSIFTDKEGALQYFVYDINATEYIKYTLADTIIVDRAKRKTITKRKELQVDITSSLWKSVTNAGGSAALVSHIEDIFQWTIDFYGVAAGDSFSFIYDENYVGGKSVGIDKILAAVYTQRGNSKYAFRYESKSGQVAFWDENGTSLQRAFLKAPIKYTRVSSQFTYRRLHPIHKVYKAHTGVDLAAPTGTPVYSIADGVVTDRYYEKAGGGNTIKIKHYVHNGQYRSGYLHLSRFADGITKGTVVKQGQLIGYVGSTGASTGPHLDFRIWKNNVPIDPMKLNNSQGDPLNKSEVPAYLEHIKENYEILIELQKQAGVTGDDFPIREEIISTEKQHDA